MVEGEQPKDILERVGFFQSPIPMWVFDTANLAFLEVNNAAILKYGYNRAEFLSMTILDIRPPEEITRLLREELREQKRNSLNEVWIHRHKNGTLMAVEISSCALAFRGRKAELVFALDHKS